VPCQTNNRAMPSSHCSRTRLSQQGPLQSGSDKKWAKPQQQPWAKANGEHQRLENDEGNHPPVRVPVLSLLHLPELVVDRTACGLIAAKNKKRQVDFEWQVSPYVIRLIRPPTIPW